VGYLLAAKAKGIYPTCSLNTITEKEMLTLKNFT